VQAVSSGNAARNGLLAALLARTNFTSSNQAIEAPRGFANVLATARRYEEITEHLGSSWEILANTYKPFACGIVIHPTIDGCIQLRTDAGLRPDQITSIELEVHPLVLELTGKKTPRTGLEGKFSVYHSAAVAIIDGGAGESQYSDDRVRDAVVIRLRDLVNAKVGAGLHEDQARITIRLDDGRVLEKFIQHAIGSKARPMSDAALEAKFRGLTEGVLSNDETDRLIERCWKIETMSDIADLARAAVPAAVVGA